MANKSGQFPLGKSEKINVAVQRPNVNVREAENLGEQAAAEIRHNYEPDVRFSKHGTTYSRPGHLDSMFPGGEP